MDKFWSLWGLDGELFVSQFGSLNTLLQQDYGFPQAIWLLLILPLLGLLHRWRGGKTDWDGTRGAKSMVFRHPLIAKLAWSSQPKTSANGWRWLLHGLRWLLVSLVIITLSQPQKEIPLPPEPQSKTVRDIVFVIESSVSFELPDYELAGQPAKRIEVVKKVVDDFISGLEGNRFGVILYAEQAYTLMPLTSDAMAARLMLLTLRSNLAGRTDEAMGEGLGLALQQAENNTDTTQKRVVVLISDGQTQPSRIPISEAINYAQGLNLPVYTVGVGSGTEEADKREVRGLLYQTLEKVSLQKIAAETLGRYYQIGSGEDLQKVLQAIDQTEGVPIEKPRKRTQVIAFYPYWAVLALITFLLYFLLVQLLANRLKPQAFGEAG